jgi:membrane-associated phospholipid phosphatase
VSDNATGILGGFPDPPAKDSARQAELRPRDRVASSRYKWTLGLSAAAVQSLFYFGISHLPLHRSTELLRTRFDDAIPFLTWTSWFYLPAYAAIFIIAISGFRSRELFNRALAAVGLVMIVGALGHIFIRAEYPRPILHPPYGDISTAFMALVQQIDRPGNVFPSLHVAQTSTLAFILYRDRPRLGAFTIFIAALLALSTMTTKQHFIADVISGYALAFAARAYAVRGLPVAVAPPATADDESAADRAVDHLGAGKTG